MGSVIHYSQENRCGIGREARTREIVRDRGRHRKQRTKAFGGRADFPERRLIFRHRLPHSRDYDGSVYSDLCDEQDRRMDSALDRVH